MRFLYKYITILFVCTSCATDIEILDPLADQPVIYCLLNQESSTQYLRLSRSYLSYTGQNVPESADSLVYFSQVEAQLELLEEGEVVETFAFEPHEVIKDTGQFPRDPHWVYKTEHQVKPNHTYRLVVYIVDTDKILYSECKTLSEFKILDPIHPDVRTIHILPDHDPVFRWTSATNAILYQLGFILHFKEIYSDSIVSRSLQIPIRSSFQDGKAVGHYSYPINSTQFYIKIAEQLEEDPGVQRKFTSLDVQVQAGGEDLAYYIQQLQNADPFRIFEFNNLMNSVGVFSAFSLEKVEGFQLTAQCIDSLAYGRFTKKLNFLDRYGNRKDKRP